MVLTAESPREPAASVFPGVAFAHAISLGANCEPAHHLRRTGRQTVRGLFDWLVTPLDAIPRILEDDGARLGTEFLATHDGTSVRCGAYDVLYHHEFPRDDANRVRFSAGLLEGCRAKMAHKMAALVEACSGGAPILFLRLGPGTDLPWDRLGAGRETASAEDLNRLAEAIARRFPALDFRLLVLVLVPGANHDLSAPLDPRIAVRTLPRGSGQGWALDEGAWREALSGVAFQRPPTAGAGLGEILHWFGDELAPPPAGVPVETGPGDMPGQVGSACEAPGHTDGTLDRLRLAVAADPGDAAALRDLVSLMVRDGDPQDGLALLDAATREGRLGPDVAVAFGRDLWAAGRSHHAVGAFEVAFRAGCRDERFLNTYLGLLTGETRYGEVLAIAGSLPDADDASAHRTMLTGHARLALAHDRGAAIAAAGDREQASSWLTADRLLDTIRQAVRDGRPFSLVRVGDGEARFLIALRPDLRPGLSRAEARAIGDVVWTNWFGETMADAEPAGLAALMDSYERAVATADVVGASDVRRLTSDTGHYGYLAAQETWLRDLARRRTGVFWTDALVHQSLHRLSPYLADILAGLDFVGIVGPHPDLAERLRERFGIADVASYPIPAEGCLPTAPETRATGRHFPDRYRELMETLRVPRPGAVFLVAGGLLGKVYCGRIRDLGGIALDIGALADGWMGFDTRFGQLREVAPLRPSTSHMPAEERTFACLSMHKTGSSALTDALRHAGFHDAIHCHFAGPRSRELRDRHRPAPARNPAPNATADLAAGLSDPGRTFALVTCVRDPIAQMISTYFQFASTRRDEQGVDIVLTHAAFVAWFERIFPLDYPTWWFDDNFRTTLGFDFRAHPFDRARRSLRFDSPRLRLLGLRHEDPAAGKKAELGWLTGRDAIALPRVNVTGAKSVGASYEDFVSSFVAPTRWVDRLYETELIQHFYTPDERDAFRARWSAPR